MSGLRRLLQGDQHKWFALVAVQLGLFMAVLDGTVVNVALPAFMRQFDADLATIDWVVLGYRVAVTAALLPAGRLADIIGRKRVYVAGIVLFTVGSGLCGISGEVGLLVAARALQGLGAALIIANTTGIVTVVFPANERGRALGINATVLAGATVLGPTLGGYLTDLFGPNSVFVINVPIGLLAVVVAWVVLDERRLSSADQKGVRLDVAGALLAALALIAALAAADPPRAFDRQAWFAPGLVTIAALALAAFIVVERRAAQPMLQLALLRIDAIRLGFFAALLSATASAGGLLVLPLYLEGVLGQTPSQAGTVLIAASVGVAVLGPIGGYLSDKLGTRLMTVGGLGVAVLAYLWLSTLGATTELAGIVTPVALFGLGVGTAVVLLPMALLGFGLGFFQPANSSAVMGGSPRASVGVVGALLGLALQLGLTLGNEASAAVLERLGGGAQLGQQLTAAQAADFLGAMRVVFLGSAVLAGAALVLSMRRREQSPQTTTPTVAPSEA
jgi:EmrB/QacA subfamily drug resistance transporter